MKNYMAVLTGNGDGCDYTIGCGVCVLEVAAHSYNDALLEIAKRRWPDYMGGGSRC